MSETWLWGGLILVCGMIAWRIPRCPIRALIERRDTTGARRMFLQQREHLEAAFVQSVFRLEPLEGWRWDAARWSDEVVWARDRRTGTLLALVGVDWEDRTAAGGRATAVFEYRRRRWVAEGRRLYAIEPCEAFGRGTNLEPLVIPLRRP
jgi:hypothetical protein